VARPPRSPPHQADPQLRILAPQGEARPQTKAEAVALQVPQAKRVVLEELQAASEVVPAATLLPPQPRLLVLAAQAALEGVRARAVPQAVPQLLLAAQAVPQLLLAAQAPPLRLLARQAPSTRKVERALAAPLTHICLLGRPQYTG
jgi:hypothetical protein